MICIGDVHGCYKTLLALMEQFPEDEVCFVGDLVDRGPRSYDVVKFVMESGYLCTMGNHEAFMCMSEDKVWAKREWTKFRNGGLQTLASYPQDDNNKAITEHRKWMRELPLYIEFEDLVDANGKHLLVSHTAIHKPLDQYIQDQESIWQRDNPLQLPGVFNIFGHSPYSTTDPNDTAWRNQVTLEPRPPVTDWYANVDTGACFDGVLSALRFPQYEWFTQKNIEGI